MALLEVLRFPDERLRTVAKPVEEVNDAIRQQVKDMFETMYEENGVGLAQQDWFSQRLIVMVVLKSVKTLSFLSILLLPKKMAAWWMMKVVYLYQTATHQ